MNTAIMPKTADIDSFKKAMADFPSGVTIITTWNADGNPIGMTLSAVTSLSIEPMLMLACFDNKANTLVSLQKKGTKFLIHVLADGQQDAAMAFSSKSSDRFSNVEWNKGLLGLPQLENSAAVFACEIHDLLPGGDHQIVVGLVKEIAVNDHCPLVYCSYKMLPASRLQEQVA